MHLQMFPNAFFGVTTVHLYTFAAKTSYVLKINMRSHLNNCKLQEFPAEEATYTTQLMQLNSSLLLLCKTIFIFLKKIFEANKKVAIRAMLQAETCDYVASLQCNKPAQMLPDNNCALRSPQFLSRHWECSSKARQSAQLCVGIWSDWRTWHHCDAVCVDRLQRSTFSDILFQIHCCEIS